MTGPDAEYPEGRPWPTEQEIVGAPVFDAAGDEVGIVAEAQNDPDQRAFDMVGVEITAMEDAGTAFVDGADAAPMMRGDRLVVQLDLTAEDLVAMGEGGGR